MHLLALLPPLNPGFASRHSLPPTSSYQRASQIPIPPVFPRTPSLATPCRCPPHPLSLPSHSPAAAYASLAQPVSGSSTSGSRPPPPLGSSGLPPASSSGSRPPRRLSYYPIFTHPRFLRAPACPDAYPCMHPFVGVLGSLRFRLPPLYLIAFVPFGIPPMTLTCSREPASHPLPHAHPHLHSRPALAPCTPTANHPVDPPFHSAPSLAARIPPLSIAPMQLASLLLASRPCSPAHCHLRMPSLTTPLLFSSSDSCSHAPFLHARASLHLLLCRFTPASRASLGVFFPRPRPRRRRPRLPPRRRHPISSSSSPPAVPLLSSFPRVPRSHFPSPSSSSSPAAAPSSLRRRLLVSSSSPPCSSGAPLHRLRHYPPWVPLRRRPAHPELLTTVFVITRPGLLFVVARLDWRLPAWATSPSSLPAEAPPRPPCSAVAMLGGCPPGLPPLGIFDDRLDSSCSSRGVVTACRGSSSSLPAEAPPRPCPARTSPTTSSSALGWESSRPLVGGSALTFSWWTALHLPDV